MGELRGRVDSFHPPLRSKGSFFDYVCACVLFGLTRLPVVLPSGWAAARRGLGSPPSPPRPSASCSALLAAGRPLPRSSTVSLAAAEFVCLSVGLTVGRRKESRSGWPKPGQQGRMYTAGLAPFYASNFSLWSAAYCTPSGPGPGPGPGAGGCFPLDPSSGIKKPSFCIADLLHAAAAAAGETAAGDGLSSAHLAAHLGPIHGPAQFHAAAGSPLRPTPVVAPDAFPARLSPLSAAYHHPPAAQHHRSPAGGAAPVPVRGPNQQQTQPGPAPAPSSKDLKFGIDRILSAEFDPKVKESNTLRGRESPAGF